MSRTSPSIVRVPMAVDCALPIVTINIVAATQTNTAEAMRTNRVLFISSSYIQTEGLRPCGAETKCAL